MPVDPFCACALPGQPQAQVGKPGNNLLFYPIDPDLKKLRGEYASLLMLMKCSLCEYESPVETQAGSFTRECYCCGTENICHRMGVHVFLIGTGEVEI